MAGRTVVPGRRGAPCASRRWLLPPARSARGHQASMYRLDLRSSRSLGPQARSAAPTERISYSAAPPTAARPTARGAPALRPRAHGYGRQAPAFLMPLIARAALPAASLVAPRLAGAGLAVVCPIRRCVGAACVCGSWDDGRPANACRGASVIWCVLVLHMCMQQFSPPR